MARALPANALHARMDCTCVLQTKNANDLITNIMKFNNPWTVALLGAGNRHIPPFTGKEKPNFVHTSSALLASTNPQRLCRHVGGSGVFGTVNQNLPPTLWRHRQGGWFQPQNVVELRRYKPNRAADVWGGTGYHDHVDLIAGSGRHAFFNPIHTHRGRISVSSTCLYCIARSRSETDFRFQTGVWTTHHHSYEF